MTKKVKIVKQVIAKEQKIANAILDRLAAVDSQTMVAGGAARDWYMGSGCNDIDIYYRSVEVAEWRLVGQLERLFPKTKFTLNEGSYVEGASPAKGYKGKGLGARQIKTVIDACIKGKDIQFICVDDINTVLDNFNCSINQVAYDLFGGVLHTEAFLLTQKSKVLIEFPWNGESVKVIDRFVDQGDFVRGTYSAAVSELIRVSK